ncbi:MAG: SDR family oxidoreductase [Acidobacteriota bacterium]
MRILVTGHCGYIGALLVPRLLAAGHEVHGLDSDLYESCTFGRLNVRVPALRKDLRDVEPEDVRGFDAVAHLAALSNDPLGDLNPELTFEINHLATVRLAEMARAEGVERFVFSSSCSNYGASGDELIDEDASFHPVTPYGRSKVLAERDLQQLADDSFSPILLRNATAFGASPRIRFDLVVNNLVCWAHTTGFVKLKSDGRAWRPLVHVEDICSALLAVLEAPRQRVHNRAFNVGRTQENYTILDVAEIVRETVPDSRLEVAGGAVTDPRNYRVSCDRIAQEVPAFDPLWTVRRGAEQVLAAVKREGLGLEEFEGARYARVPQLRLLLSQGRLDETLRRVAR